MDEQTVTIEAPTFPPPHPPRQPTPRWYQLPTARDSDDHKVGGVIAGLSRTYGFDVRTTRIAVVIAAFVLPAVIVMYVAAWLLLPSDDDRATSLQAIAGDRRRLPLYIAIGIAVVAGGAGTFGSWFFLGGLPWGLGLIVLGMLLWAAPGRMRSNRQTTSADGTFVPSGPFAAGTAVPPPPFAADASAAWVADRSEHADEARPRRRRRPIASLVLIAVLVFAGIAAAGDALDLWNIPVLTAVIISLISTAAGFVASAIANRSWAGFPIIALLAAVTTGLVITQPKLEGGMGARTVTPATAAMAERLHQLSAGELIIDLTQVPVRSESIEVSAEVGIGHLHVIVPADATVVIDAQIGAGDVLVDGAAIADGVRHHDQRTLQPLDLATDSTDSSGTIRLDVDLGIGRIDIERRTPAATAGPTP